MDCIELFYVFGGLKEKVYCVGTSAMSVMSATEREFVVKQSI